MQYFIGVDLGGTNIKAAALDVNGNLLEKVTLPTNDSSCVEQVRFLVGEIERSRAAPAAGIGLATPGVVASDGLSVVTTSGKTEALRNLDGLNWTEALARSRAVPVLNDAQAALLGEAWLGAAAGFEHVILLTLGTGVGGAIMADGRLLHGWRGIAGHLGHICLDVHGEPTFMGTPGALESAIGNCTIGQRSIGRFHSTRELVQAHMGGDVDAGKIWLTSIHALACGIVSLINILDPQAIIIGGGIAQAGEALFEPLRLKMATMEFHIDERRVQVLPASLGDWAGAYGAARNALGP